MPPTAPDGARERLVGAFSCAAGVLPTTAGGDSRDSIRDVLESFIMRSSLFSPVRIPGLLASIVLLIGRPAPVPAQPGGFVAADSGPRCAIIEAFVRPDSPRCDAARAFLDRLARERRGIHLVYRDVSESQPSLDRLEQLSKYFRLEEPVVPSVYLCRNLVTGWRDEETTGRRVEDLLTVEVFVRDGCPRCANAKAFLRPLHAQYPGFHFVYREIISDSRNRARWEEVSRQNGVGTPGIPTFHLGGRAIVGFDGPESTGAQVEAVLKGATFPCPAAAPVKPTSDRRSLPQRSRWGMLAAVGLPSLLAADGPDDDGPPPPDATPAPSVSEPPPPLADEPPAPLASEPPPPLGDDPADGPPPPMSDVATPAEPKSRSDRPALPRESSGDDVAAAPPEEEAVPLSADLPIFGRVDVRNVGMPAFTLAIGLIDGFNPCAMWVLLFLLSVLVNLKDRRKIIAVAGTFVIVSGLVYFAFMAAWLNFFQLVGHLKPIEVTLGIIGVVVGLINVKDFFAFKKGISLSIPESAKPGLYSRVRGIVSARNLSLAISGAIVLAVMVNAVEMLCTAGLPALYTKVLTMQQLPTWQYYAYLGLYIAAYMFDDALMLGVVLVTMSHRKLQEKEGRWLKLVSGGVILAMGLVMLVKPEWLV